jgi:transcriptional regulator with XRE-family HTH domain
MEEDMGEVSLIGRRLRAYRRRAKMSQQKLADEVGIPRSMIAAVESGHRQGFNVETLIKICDVLGLSLDQLARPNPDESHMLAASVR